MLIQDVVNNSSAVMSAWLPGTAGGDGIANALTGKYRFRPSGSADRRNTLAFDWPKTHVFHYLFRILSNSFPFTKHQESSRASVTLSLLQATAYQLLLHCCTLAPSL